MCIAIYKKEGIKLLERVLEECFNRNPDGAGFCYSNEGKIVIEKGFFEFKEFLEAFTPFESKECLVHFRIKTHGDLSKEMCHPFAVNDHIAMIHNGIISGHGTGNQSDTYEFVEEIIKPSVQKYGEDILGDKVFQTLVEKYVGGSKLMFMNSETGEHFIYNKNLCNEVDEVVFSNHSWKPIEQKSLVLFPKNHTQYQNDYWDEFDEFPQSNKRYKQKQKEKRTEVKSIVNYKNDKYSVDDFASLSWDDASAGKKGDVIIIEKCYSDLTLDIYNVSADMAVTGVQLYLIGKVDEEELKKL